MAVSTITVACPACGSEITCNYQLCVDTMPSPKDDSPKQSWRGDIQLDDSPIQAHLLTHYVPDDSQ